MGKRTDQAERNVVQQRERLSQMVTDLNQRITNDAQVASQRVADRASELQQRAGDAMEKVPGTQTIGEQIPKHPLTSMAAGLSAGMALGMLGGGGGGSDGQSSRNSQRASQQQQQGRSNGNNGNGGGGFLDGITSAAITSIALPIQREVESVAREALNGFMGKASAKSDQQSSREAAEQLPPEKQGTTLS